MSTTTIYCGHENDSPDPQGMRISKQQEVKKHRRRKVQRKSKNKRPDFQEVKNDRHIGENELFQGIKYVGRHKRKGIEMHPLMIWNNSKERHQFDDNRISDAENHKYGILTTEELLKGYLKVKQNKINLKLFNTIILQTGLIKFSNSTIKRMKSG